MKRTKEIRWFFKNENRQVKDWFDKLPFQTQELRKDFYLALENEDVGVKIREDNFEIKYRIGTRASDCLNNNIWGYYETFVKWSLKSNEKDPLLDKILNYNYEDWVPVEKRRKIALLTKEEGKIIAKPINSDISSGCQVEYAAITVANEPWFTIALEWFGDSTSDLDTEIISGIFGNSKLKIRQSRGYGDFLSKCLNGGRSKLLPIP